jgi:hypothetical protein
MCKFFNTFPAIAALMLTVAAAGQGRQERNSKAVTTAMRNIHYHFTNSIVIEIHRADGRLLPQTGHDIPVFDDPKSFILAIDSAEMSISTDAMTHLMNEYTFARGDAPLKKIVVSVAAGKLKVKGVLHNKGDLPFETEGFLAATPDGLIRVHAEKIRAAHLPAKGIMDLFGVEIADLVKTNKVPGVRVENDDLMLDPQQLFPPPAIQGHVSGVVIRGNDIVLTFGKPGGSSKPPVAGIQNYMAYRGGTLRFGKLTMADTDLVLVDADQHDSFDFSLSEYSKQLVAGYSKTTSKSGLVVYMPDYRKLGNRPNGGVVSGAGR